MGNLRHPLFDAVVMGDLDKVVALLQAGADANMMSEDGRTPLMHAVLRGHVAIVKALVDAGADPKHKDAKGLDVFKITPHFDGYHNVSAQDRQEIVIILQKAGY